MFDGITVRFMLRITTGATAASFRGSLVTLQAPCDVLRVKALLWRESMTWGLIVSRPSPPAGRSSCQMSTIGGLFVFEMVRET
eukprot:s674_g19.t1